MDVASDTPRTDASLFCVHTDLVPEVWTCNVEFARTLERELTIAYDRIRRLEKAGNEMAVRLSVSADIEGHIDVEKWNKVKESKP